MERLSFDCRVLPHINLDDVIMTVMEVIEKVMSQTGAKIEFSIIERDDAAASTSPNLDFWIKP
ncbi:MAG: hypothetical protein FWE49_00710 [Synergistaceae bacterium]|nr:hypothetical protein [Synergistaceae bacterium]